MLIFDIETKTFGKPNSNKDELRFLGAYSYITKEYYFYSYKEKEKIKELFKKHKIIIGFYSDNYDIPILKRYGIRTMFNLCIDLRKIIKKRVTYLKIKIDSYSLKNICKKLKLEEQKQHDFDYTILNKDKWTNDELEYIKAYTLQDIKTTKKLFEYIYNFFLPLKEYMSKNDQLNMKWLTSTIAGYAYKVICHNCNLNEEYDDTTEHTDYGGGYVMEPIEEEAHNNIICFDFASLYPHIYIQNNLFSQNCNCCVHEEKWRGDEYYEIKGTYCTKKRGRIEELLHKFYKERAELKKAGDKREYTLKIIINSIYGAAGTPIFKNLYNYNCARDCTSIGRTCIKTAIKMFEEYGIKVLYGDTDSCYVQTKDKQLAIKTANKITLELQKHMNMPVDTFKFKIDDEINHIWFRKTNGKNNKKNYLYVTKEGKLVIKGLPLIKSDGSGIGLYVFNKYMKELIKTGYNKFEYKTVKKWVYEELKQNPLLASKRFKTWDLKNYKLDSQIQAQITKRYGTGLHYLIPNKKIGIGKGDTKYCTKEEFEKHNLNEYNIRLDNMWNELDMFIKNKRGNQEELLRWTNIT